MENVRYSSQFSSLFLQTCRHGGHGITILPAFLPNETNGWYFWVRKLQQRASCLLRELFVKKSSGA